ncbi:MAG: YegS/Rv2252/BmrU family lipid kinase [Oscillospiraceae bacterium]|nr:YegS/Rv2252/BmrU family lipid kinase [Oscillospiraceae bacterium]
MPDFIFIINPAAGKGAHMQSLCARIQDHFSACGQNFAIHLTTGAGDALDFVRAYPQSQERQLCFVACGGDGTLHEVVNGAAGRQDCTVSVIPCGSGNDYVKNFSGAEAFTDLKRLINGRPYPVDLLDCSGEYTINLCNIGFDARVAHHMSKFKRIPLVSGPLAYTLSLIFCLAGPVGSAVTLSFDGAEAVAEQLILAVAANGFCYGGGYYPVPDACPADGQMEFCGVRKMSRLQMSRFISVYKKGEHLKDQRLATKILYHTGHSLKVKGKRPLIICLDGEIRKRCEFSIRLLPAALSFWLPEGAALAVPSPMAAAVPQ